MPSEGSTWPECIVSQESDLGDLIHFVPDDVTVVETPDGLLMGWGDDLRRFEPGIVYRASEALQLARADLRLEDLRAIHAVKKILGGRVDHVEPQPRRLWTEEEVCTAWSGWSIEERERYTALRVRALVLLGASEAEATLEQRTVAASWAAEHVSRLSNSTTRKTQEDTGA